MADTMLSTPPKNPFGMHADAREFKPDGLHGMRADAREFVPSTPSTSSSTAMNDSVVAASSPSETGAWSEDVLANDFDESQVWNYLPAVCHDDFGIAGAGCVQTGSDASFLAEACVMPQQWPLSLDQLPSLQPQDPRIAMATQGNAIPIVSKSVKGSGRSRRQRGRGGGHGNGAQDVPPMVLSTMPPPLPVPALGASQNAQTNGKVEDSPRSHLLTLCGAWGALVTSKTADENDTAKPTVISIDPSDGIPRQALLRYKAVSAGKCPSPLATFKARPAPV